jgi:hypothetical protein
MPRAPKTLTVLSKGGEKLMASQTPKAAKKVARTKMAGKMAPKFQTARECYSHNPIVLPHK